MRLASAATIIGATPTTTWISGLPSTSRRTAWNTTNPQPMATTVAATEAEWPSPLPCPYGWSSSAGQTATRTLTRAAVPPTRSVALSMASDRTAMLPLTMPRVSLRASRPTVAPREIAAIRTGPVISHGETDSGRLPLSALARHHLARRLRDGLRGKAEVLQQFVPAAAGAVAVLHADEGHRHRPVAGDGLRDEASQATVDLVVLRRHDSAGLRGGGQDCFRVGGLEGGRVQHAAVYPVGRQQAGGVQRRLDQHTHRDHGDL